MKFAVLFDLALQMQRNGLGALPRDILTRQKALIKFNVVAYGDGDGGAGSGIRTRVTSLEGWCINPYTMPA